MSACPGELDVAIDPATVEGSVPESLRTGRLLSNGPGWTQIGGWTAHPFDGHGYVRALELTAQGGLRLRGRFVGTRVYRDEAAADAFVHRGFATNVPGSIRDNLGLGGRDKVVRNVANTTIVRWGDQLLAGWEAGEPHALDLDSLATRGVETFGGAIAGQATLAHMRRDLETQRLLLCSPATGRRTTLSFREVDEGGQLCASRQAEVGGPMFAHDFAFTPNYYILAANPLRVQVGELAKTLVGRSTLLRSVASSDKLPGTLHLIPRTPDDPVRSVRLPGPAFVIHFANAFERDGAVIVDACVFDTLEFGEEFGYTGPTTPFDPALPDARRPQRLVRYVIAPGASEATAVSLSPYAVDFPSVHPGHGGRESPMLFGASRADTRHSDPFDSIVAVDLLDLERPTQLWTAPEDVFVGEPLLAPDPAGDGPGHVLAILSDGLRARSELVIFEADALAAGPVARIPMPLLPVAFHGDWDASPTASA